ncbi:AIPR family protein [Klebsiella aerogenes]|uniref:AIPR family protein n=1 Tax=Klebsiella aerogenes TaxID=548 RepID=UPI001EF01DC2|nr:AIPR family protein [Klebsiella aerogenes]EKU6158237.1 AIPR family protein [Klebsiella aerogenes]MCG6821169.1 AIPR family protein [Klebsiella aerogenes]HCT4451981.1 AIPR family protein [Klebsiella aerogenes]
MANLLDWNTLHHKVHAYLDIENGIDKPQKAFPILMVATLLNVSDEEAEDAITDGSMDRGGDAVYVDDRDGRNSIHIFQFKYADNYENTKKNFPSNEIDKLVSFFSDLLDLNRTLEKTCNPILWNKVKEIWAALEKNNPSIEVHFCGNTVEMQEGEKERANASLSKYKYFNVHHHSLDTIVNYFVERKNSIIDERLQIVDKDYFDRTDGSIRGLICTVEASEIVRIITNPDNPKEVRKEIFNDNVRVYLSRTNKINRRIIETALSERSPLFWYLNNGITITCDSFSYIKGKRAPLVELSNIQIVNGGQTSNALFEASLSSDEALDDVLILVRIIETKSQPVSLAIAESTNSQTPIKSRDLRSNDDIQKKLEEAFEGMGLYYDRKDGQHSNQQKNIRIDALSAGQAHLAYSLDLPEVAKKDRGRIFSDLYETIFTDELMADDLLAATKVLAVIEHKKKLLQSSIRKEEKFNPAHMFLIDGAYHVLFAVGQLCDVNNVDRLNYQKAITFVPTAIKYIGVMVEKAQRDDASFSFNRYFKDAKTKTKIAAYIQGMAKAK